MECIYIIKNFKNDKIYIGQTKQDLKKRFRQHINEAYDENRKRYKSCLSRAIRKYGKEYFDIATLAEVKEGDDIDIIEGHYIDLYSATDPKYGYNMSVGSNDNSNIDEYREMMPKEDYSDNSKVLLDDITDEDVDRFLREL